MLTGRYGSYLLLQISMIKCCYQDWFSLAPLWPLRDLSDPQILLCSTVQLLTGRAARFLLSFQFQLSSYHKKIAFPFALPWVRSSLRVKIPFCLIFGYSSKAGLLKSYFTRNSSPPALLTTCQPMLRVLGKLDGDQCRLCFYEDNRHLIGEKPPFYGWLMIQVWAQSNLASIWTTTFFLQEKPGEDVLNPFKQ